jgi:hypothetical protein
MNDLNEKVNRAIDRYRITRRDKGLEYRLAEIINEYRERRCEPTKILYYIRASNFVFFWN